jgi:hypothetical protein
VGNILGQWVFPDSAAAIRSLKILDDLPPLMLNHEAPAGKCSRRYLAVDEIDD